MTVFNKKKRDDIEEGLTSRDDKRDEILQKLQRSQDSSEDRSKPQWEMPKVGDW